MTRFGPPQDQSARAWVTLGAFLALLPQCALALDPTLSPTQYLHTSWTQEQGIALPGIKALAQTDEGYLWLGTDRGLIRFDGMRFVAQEVSTEERDIRYLASGPDQSLWIATSCCISRLERNGRVSRFLAADRWLGGKIRTMARDHSGRLWVVRLGPRSEIASLDSQGSLRQYGVDDGLPDGGIKAIVEDEGARLWVATADRVCAWSPGQPSVCAEGIRESAMTPDKSSGLVLVDGLSRNLARLTANAPELLAAVPPDVTAVINSMSRDRDGAIWLGTAGLGLFRFARGRVQGLTRLDSLSSDYVRALLEDREGNLWVGTARGLDRFRDPRVQHLSTLEGLSSDVVTAVCAARDGATWVGTGGGGINKVAAERIIPYTADSGLPSTAVTALYEDTFGRLWIGADARFGYYEGNRFVPVRTTENGALKRVFAITADPSGTIWVADGRQGLFSVRDGRARGVNLPGLRSTDIYQLFADSAGSLWIGHFDGGLTVVENGQVTNYSEQGGLAGGAIQAIAQDRSGAIWVGAKHGLSRLRQGRWTTWGVSNGIPDGGVFGIVQDDRSALWLMTSQGLSRVQAADLERSPDGLPQRLEILPYGQSDGVRLATNMGMANPRISKSLDGRIWICTDNGVAIVDPARIRINQTPPGVVIEEVVVDGKTVLADRQSEISFRGNHVRITYTGLSLSVPDHVRFRYKLEGLDHEWVDAGGRRSIDYVNLSPRRYRFHVIACNSDGVWNSAGSSLAFRLEPFFYQTWWFAALCAATAITIAWSVHRARLRRVLTRFQAASQERARLTRELHDSLLQGFAGVVYQLESAAQLFDHSPALSRIRLDKAIDQADRALKEARMTMASMRLPALDDHTLPEALEATAKRITDGTPIAFHLSVRGRVRHLPYDAQANVFLIGREAITNSVNHSRAKRISAGLVYSAKGLKLYVEDDGEGFNTENRECRPDHWGMSAMRERATQIGARLTISSAPGHGTRVELVLPRKD